MFYLLLGWAVLAILYVSGKIGEWIRSWWARRDEPQPQVRKLTREETVELAARMIREWKRSEEYQRYLREWEAQDAIAEAERIVRARR